MERISVWVMQLVVEVQPKFASAIFLAASLKSSPALVLEGLAVSASNLPMSSEQNSVQDCLSLVRYRPNLLLCACWKLLSVFPLLFHYHQSRRLSSCSKLQAVFPLLFRYRQSHRLSASCPARLQAAWLEPAA
jgi:hypothetical protein